MEIEINRIEEKLDKISAELDYIKEHMVDGDMVLDSDDRESLRQSRKEKRDGKTTSLENLKKELGF